MVGFLFSLEGKLLSPSDFFNLDDYQHRALFHDSRVEYVWDAIKLLADFLDQLIVPDIQGEVMDGAVLQGDKIYIGPGAVVEPGAMIKSPAYIGAKSEVRQGAYLRGNVLVGSACVIGHTTEVKNAIFLDGAHASHFAYVADSIVGNRVNLGAGTKLANLKLDRASVAIHVQGRSYDTGLRKFGAILGDGVQIGCNTVLNPGTLLGPECVVYAMALVRGYHPPRTRIKVVPSLQVSQMNK
jgi:NDP-sugar pyrophosphorylase family protein